MITKTYWIPIMTRTGLSRYVWLNSSTWEVRVALNRACFILGLSHALYTCASCSRNDCRLGPSSNSLSASSSTSHSTLRGKCEDQSDIHEGKSDAHGRQSDIHGSKWQTWWSKWHTWGQSDKHDGQSDIQGVKVTYMGSKWHTMWLNGTLTCVNLLLVVEMTTSVQAD